MGEFLLKTRVERDFLIDWLSSHCGLLYARSGKDFWYQSSQQEQMKCPSHPNVDVYNLKNQISNLTFYKRLLESDLPVCHIFFQQKGDFNLR